MSGDTRTNRDARGWKVYMALAESAPGTRVAFPSLAGTAISWGTAWAQLPSPSNDPDMTVTHKMEDFRPAQYLHRTDADLVEIGMEKISWECKESDLDAMNTALLGSLIGTVTTGSGSATWHYLKQPLAGTDIPMYQLAFVRQTQAGGWGQVVWVPNVKRTIDGFLKPAVGKVATQKMTFDAFATETDLTVTGSGTNTVTVVPEGASYCTFEYQTLGTA